MILNQLIIQALGPYKGKEVIDFDTLNKAQLFAISGNTGAGKTAIFDGICYALYGRASGQHRSNAEELRCIYADDEDYTEATLEFTIQSQRYKASRLMGHIKRNNKTKTGGAMELHRWTVSDETAEAGWESMLESGKVSEMNEKVLELTGLDVDQFRQIVMLPQGEFEKLLLAKAEDKMRVLRQIFHTSLYQRFTEKLDQRRKDAELEYHQYRQNIRSREDSLEELLKEEESLAVNELLQEGERNTYRLMEILPKDIKNLEEEAKKLEMQLEQQDGNIQKADEAYHQAKQNNRQIEELESQRQKMKELQERKAAMDKKQQSLEEAHKAQKIEHLYRRREESRKEYEQKTKGWKLAEEKFKTTEEKLVKAQKEWENHQKETPLRQEKEKQYNQMLEALPKVKDLSDKKGVLLKQQKEAEKLQQELGGMKKTLQSLQEKLKEKKEERETLASELEEEPRLLKKQSALHQQHKERQEVIRLKDEEKQLQEKTNKARSAWETCKKETKSLENRWIENQAAFMAVNLQKGQPCPVCGSHEHPKKATGLGDEISREKLEKAKEQESVSSGKRIQLATKLETTQQAIHDLVEQWEVDHSSMVELKKQEKTLAEEKLAVDEKLNRIENQRKKDQELKREMDAAEKEIGQLSEKLKQVEEKRQHLEEQMAVRRGNIESIQESIPENLMNLEQMETQMNSFEEELKKAQQAYEKAEKQYSRLREERATAGANLQNAGENAKEAKKVVETVWLQWQESLLREGFSSEEAYAAASMPAEQIKSLQYELQQFRDQWTLTEEKIKHMEKALQKMEKADLEALLQYCNQLRREQKQLQKKYGRKEALVREAASLKESIEKEWAILQQVEEKRNRFTELYQCANGTGNDQKLALETYVLQHYFHRVLAAANLRLDELTMGRYRLVADEEREKHGGRSGLGIDVIDSFNEQRRSVRTFSGGEKFNASLCLALGLFDVIQSESGGTEMKTMFIDEGFGSLDTQESLPRAIQMLNRIQETGRVIGVISHVSEMKEQLPAVLEVIKRPDGSSTTSIRVNA